MFYLLFLGLCLLPSDVFAQGVIGSDQVITFPVVNILAGTGPYVQVFNYFWSLMMFSGLISVFFKNVIRLFRRNYY